MPLKHWTDTQMHTHDVFHASAERSAEHSVIFFVSTHISIDSDICSVPSISKECNQKLIVVCVWFRCWNNEIVWKRKQNKTHEHGKHISILWTLINLNTIMWIIFERWSRACTIPFDIWCCCIHTIPINKILAERSYIPSVYFLCLFVGSCARAVFQ